MKTITLAAIVMSLACSAASAQEVEVTEQRYTKDRLVTTYPDGSTEETTRSRDGRGTTTYTTTRTPVLMLPAPVQLPPGDDAADFSAVVENLPRTNSLRSSLYTAADTVANADAVPRTNSLRSSFYTPR
jgi:hypothetical protein